MQFKVQKYVKDDEGTVTIDWVVIVGFAVALTLSVITAISTGMEERGTKIVSPAAVSTTF